MRHSSTSRLRWRLLGALALVAVLASACGDDERREIRLTPTSTVETGVRVLVDNCPGPSSVVLSVREDVLWEVQAPADADATEESEAAAETVDDTALVQSEPEPGLREFLVGQQPDDWSTVTPLAVPLEPGIRYTITTQPDGQSIDFATPDLAPGLLWDGVGNAQFNPNLINVECSQPADFAKFAENIVFLIGLGVTASALVLVALILLLFVVTRRFSRVRALQNRSAKEQAKVLADEPQKVVARSSK